MKFIFFNSDIPGINFRLIAFVKEYTTQFLVLNLKKQTLIKDGKATVTPMPESGDQKVKLGIKRWYQVGKKLFFPEKV